MDVKTGFFYLFSVVLLYAAFRVITARNPVHAVLHLILAFSQAAGLWLLLKAEFLAIALVLVYLGAVMVLFLFVVMMLDLNFDQLRQGFWRYLPLGAMLGLVMVLEMGLVLGSKYFQVPLSEAAVEPGISNTRELGALLVTDYVFPFELAAVILLVGMVAAVVLTFRGGPKRSRVPNPSTQLYVKAKDRVRVLQMPVEKD